MKYLDEYNIIFLIKGRNIVKEKYRENFISNLSILSKRFEEFKINIYPENYKIFTKIPFEYVSKINLNKIFHFFRGKIFCIGRNISLKDGIFVIKGNIWDLTEENLYYTIIQLHRLTFYAPLKFKFISEIEEFCKEKIYLLPEIEEKIEKTLNYDNQLLEFIKKTEKLKCEPFLWGKRTGTIRKEIKEKINKSLNFFKIIFRK
ncbi:MAG: hypothetical protein ACP5OB_04435 [Candidatus Ratteibacteria bacterium]